MNRPLSTEYAADFQGYVDQVSESDIMQVMRSELDDLDVLLGSVPADKESFAYAEGKWTIREVVGHLIDAERVFGYRALCIARGEQQCLAGFDENAYQRNSPYHRIELEELLSEMRLVRLSNIAMFRSLDEEAWTRVGTANDNPVSVRAIVFIMAGHVRHHIKVLKERYLTSASTADSASV